MNIIRRRIIAAMICGIPALKVLAAGIPTQNNSNAFMTALRRDRNNYALLYFVQQGCPYCARETPVLRDFQQQTGWYIKEVDIHAMPEVRTKFNISKTPTIVLIRRDMDSRSWQPVSQGFSPADILSRSIFGITRVLNGEADPGILKSLLIQGESTPFAEGL